MKKLFDYFKNIQFTEKSIPWVLLIACVFAFGLLIPQLGYYQDDWNVVFNHYRYGNNGIIDLLKYDGRPFASWIYIGSFAILGYKPIAWHIAALVMRWFSAVTIWSIFKRLWPNAGWQSFTAAIIFLIYPFFTLQPLAATFIHHWTGYLLFGLSILFMLRALQGRFWLNTSLALITQVLHLLTLEFYAGLELLRPILIWIVLSTISQDVPKEKIKNTLRIWLPYLIALILYFIWRGFLYQAPDEIRNAPVGLAALLDTPFATLKLIAFDAIPDLVLILFSSWYKILEPASLNFSVSANRYAFLIGLVGFALSFFYLSKLDSPEKSQNKSTTKMLVTGIIALLLGLVPVYAAGFVIHTKIAPWNSRFGLGLLPGAALIITALIDFVVKVPRTRWVIISILFGLLLGWHVRYTNDFRWVWDKQVNFYRQLYLRAPDISPGTAILSEEEFLMFMGDYPTSYGINLIYAEKGADFNDSRKADYWFFPFVEFYTKLDQHLNGEPFSTVRAGTTFDGEPEGSIAISFEPGLGQCLWVMRPEYASAKSFSQTMRQLASISYVDRIQQAPLREDSFLLKYLYTNPEQDWCYYYEKADLAYQYEEWDEVIQLWESAKQNNLQPENGFEYLPFIEAYAHTGDWETAKSMTRISQKTLQGIDPLLCNIWSKLEGSTSNSVEKDETILSVKEDLRCDQE